MLPCLVESTLHFPYTSNRSVGAAKSISISISMLSQQQQQQQQKAALPTEIVPLIALNMRQVAASFRPRALPALLLLLLWFGVTMQPSVSQSLTVSLSVLRSVYPRALLSVCGGFQRRAVSEGFHNPAAFVSLIMQFGPFAF